MIQSGKRTDEKKPAMETFTPTKISREPFDEEFGIISQYMTGGTVATMSATLVLGLRRDELDWLWLQLESFCNAHKFNILAPEIQYQTYIVD